MYKNLKRNVFLFSMLMIITFAKAQNRTKTINIKWSPYGIGDFERRQFALLGFNTEYFAKENQSFEVAYFYGKQVEKSSSGNNIYESSITQHFIEPSVRFYTKRRNVYGLYYRPSFALWFANYKERENGILISSDRQDNLFYLGQSFGIERVIGKHFTFDINFGILGSMYKDYNNDNKISVLGRMSVGLGYQFYKTENTSK